MLINDEADVYVTDICHKRPPCSIFRSYLQNIDQTALIKACIYNNFKCVDRLIEGVARRNVKD